MIRPIRTKPRDLPEVGTDARVETIALSALPTGSTATLAGDRLNDDDRQILRAMGFTDRSPVRVCRQGEPCIVEVRTTRVGLARSIAECLHAVPIVAATG